MESWHDLRGLPLILPSTASDIRSALDLLCEQLDVRRTVLAEIDDMAMLRVLARGAKAAAVLPTVVVRDELLEGRLEEYCKLPNLYENFFPISIKRHFHQPLLKTLLSRSEADVLTGAEPIGTHKKTVRKG